MVRVVIIGMGPIGVACARALETERDMQLVGLVDIDPAKQGKTLDDLDDQPDRPESPSPQDWRVMPDLEAALAGGSADVAIIATTSRFDRLAPLLRQAMALGLHVVTSCEEMAWPWYQHGPLAREIDADARRLGKALLGTGVNPGFVMDFLALTLSTAVRRVSAVRCMRRVDAGLRRVPLQLKVGATLSLDQFNLKKAAGKIGHVGLPESVAMLAHGLGRHVEPGSVQIALEPVIATQPVQSALGLIEPGRVAGIHNTAHWANASLDINLDLTMAVAAQDPKDIIELTGPVSFKCILKGGLPGDSATVAVLLNYARALPAAPPGLHSMLSLPIAPAHGQDR